MNEQMSNDQARIILLDWLDGKPIDNEEFKKAIEKGVVALEAVNKDLRSIVNKMLYGEG